MNKETCEMLGDFVRAGERLNPIYKERSGNVNMTTEVRDAILELMAQTYCRNVGFGDYTCYAKTMADVYVDTCLCAEINNLNNSGIKTIGCCCGHGKQPGYIQVAPEYVEIMIKNEYIQRPLDEHGNGKWCFFPKTPLPKAIKGA